MKSRSQVLLALLLFLLLMSLDAVASRSLPVLGVHPTSLRYWEDSIYANAIKQGTWLEYEGRDWGQSISEFNNPQFDRFGNPLYLMGDKKLKIIPAAFSHEFKPDGVVTLKWDGDADIRINRAENLYIEELSNGPATDSINNGIRAYRLTGNDIFWIEVSAINPENPPKNIRAYLPDPNDPETRSLNDSHFWHPDFLARMLDIDNSVIRTMGLTETNGSPEQDWQDRRQPEHIFASGLLNSRSPVPDGLANGKEVKGDRRTGVAWEHLVHLANATGHDLWINVPHMATEDYIRNLALLIKYGSDGDSPYTTQVDQPVWHGLNPGQRVWVEYSNEVWSRGNSFPQGDYAEVEGEKLGIDKWQFTARKFVDTWNVFDEVFDDPDRVVNVAALHTGSRWYVENFAKEMQRYIDSQGLAIAPDVQAVTIYFGNGIQDWAVEKARATAGASDHWFMMDEQYERRNGDMDFATFPEEHSYWQSDRLKANLDEIMDEWIFRILSGNETEGAGPDLTGVIGGFREELPLFLNAEFNADIPVVAYEGGPSIYTYKYDSGDKRNAGVTDFIIRMNEHPRIQEVYAIQLNIATAKGLQMHMPFTLQNRWGKWGQWGHVKRFSDTREDAPKYDAVLTWMENELEHQPVVYHPYSNAFRRYQLNPAHYAQPYNAEYMVSNMQDIQLVSTTDTLGLDIDLSQSTIHYSGAPNGKGKIYSLFSYTQEENRQWVIVEVNVI